MFYLAMFIIGALATYRLSMMIATEEGPFSIFYRIRVWVWKLFGTDSWILNGIECPMCLSFWISFLFALPFWHLGYVIYVTVALALSAIATILVLLLGKPHDDNVTQLVEALDQSIERSERYEEAYNTLERTATAQMSVAKSEDRNTDALLLEAALLEAEEIINGTERNNSNR